ncbi:peptide chain release factor N(5)-glutamine methyltransferase [Aquimarina sp. 2201CG5-10]|uniref:peptide chain release factor N(5)-glutamine methyltransferase n=1 Tax=Aquimarina callyspongiae TaxID=3098150 RepID=UPI002AB5B503|nr:peptide chain release factor N(5)-glutamine methyltransferase [Aquimarina sp. 2201CG5-10]MDY8138278.1 peptide chain release factor N(5)-glutamine methyltransferase [Aquimarina sp. 2201CG5-10]
MQIKDLRTSFVASLSEKYGSEEALSFFYMLTTEFFSLKRVDIALQLTREVSDEELLNFKSAQSRLETQEPIQYILGHEEFYGARFIVNQHVLIPRPETEELVNWIIKDYAKTKTTLKILDIGTGSGCIAISLAKKIPNSKVYAIDVSEEALKVAKQNASLNKVDIQFIKADILEENDLKEEFEIIVSNPPYVRELEKQEIKPNVLDHEPHQALFVEDGDPLVFYEKIASLAKKNLKNNGVLYFEINQYLGEATKNMIRDMGFASVVLRKDIYQNDRMIKACIN